MTQPGEVAGNVMATLSHETLAVLANLAKRLQAKSEYEIISEAVSELAGSGPDTLIKEIEAAGGSKELIEAMADEVRRLRKPTT